jgi:ssDNA-binding Zn-finger/Zn-ribbon topoisomerase 1
MNSGFICGHCHEPLVCSERGMVHAEGGAYAMRCTDCDWYGSPHPSPVACPRCGSPRLADDHAVIVRRS